MNKPFEFLHEIKNKTLCDIDIRYDEPMARHTSFKAGGNAECFVRPAGNNFPVFCAELLKCAKKNGVPVFILGGGANILVSDNGVRGIVLNTGGWKGLLTENNNRLVFKSGTTMDEAAEYALEKELSGLEFLAGMPGTIGGAVYMNARCYGKEIADVLEWTEIIDQTIKITRINTDASLFSYKHSPFMDTDGLILNASFKLQKGNKDHIKTEMEKNKQDRRDKGHYLFPCAGSVFKNNRAFGKPTGMIIDELGLRGLSEGDAEVASFHGNIIINKGKATAGDIKALMDKVSFIVKEKTGFCLEPEIIYVN